MATYDVASYICQARCPSRHRHEFEPNSIELNGALDVASNICRALSVGLAWGAVAVGAPASSKRFFCVNTGPRDMEVEFTPWIDPDPGGGGGGGGGGGERYAHTKMSVDEATGLVSLEVGRCNLTPVLKAPGFSA